MNNKMKLSDLIAPAFIKTIDPLTKIEVEMLKSMAKIQINRGGRMSFKTTFNILKILLLLMKNPYCDWIYVRKKKNTIWDTVFPAILETCHLLGLEKGRDFFSPTKDITPHTFLFFKLKNGSSIKFDGMFDEGDTKGIKPSVSGKSQFVGITYFEVDQIVEKYETIQEAMNVIENYASSFIRNSPSQYWRNGKPFFLEFYEYNPPANKNHIMYQFEEMLFKRSDSIALTTRYYDHPTDLLVKWVGQDAILKAENLKTIDYQQWLSVYGAQAAKLHGGCYPKYDIDNSNIKQTKMTPEYVQENYKAFYVGVDTGSTNATVFTFIGVSIRNGQVPKIGIINRYYHKNNITKELNGSVIIKDVNDFAKDFYDFAEVNKSYIGEKAFETYFESADPSSRIVYERYMQKRTVYCNFYKVNKKKKRDDNVKSAIQERVNFGNTLLNGAEIEYNINENVLGLSIAFTDAKYGKDGQRADKGETDIDSLDSFEYALSTIFSDLVDSTIYNYGGGIQYVWN